RRVQQHGLSFFEGMRLLAGASLERDQAGPISETTRAWTGLTAGPELEAMLKQSGPSDGRQIPSPRDLRAGLRPYQGSGLSWLHFLTQLGLGACLADDMGLGKTLQVIALLLALKEEPSPGAPGGGKVAPSLLAVPASLIANWKAEIERFAPSLKYRIA